ncbi:sugar nucleotide-binding protein [Brevibacillus agri]|uniref:sugar nucleotide-binding protein n=1 Tax=Brevibacillus agri TaxID=51101 RepID=UPI000471C01D|nr:sugar nucleotide-binding protein [Brevibacillus agri]
MNKHRVLLLGASGYLGAQIWQELRRIGTYEIVGTYCSSPASDVGLVQMDVTDSAAFAALLDEFAPDVAIWALMSTADEQAMIAAGMETLLGRLPAKSRLIYLSTDGVFGQGTGSFAEDDQPVLLDERNPLAGYSHAKWFGETLIRERHDQHVIARIGPIYGCNSRGRWDKRIAAIRQELEAGREVVRTGNLYKTFLHVQDAGRAIAELAGNPYVGTLHLGPAQKESYYSFARKMAAALGLDAAAVKEDRLDDTEARAKGIPLDTSLDTSRAREILHTRFRQVGAEGTASGMPLRGEGAVR